jgi:hypothetical protein
MSDQNLAVVHGAYEAFGRGDIPAVLGGGLAIADRAWPESAVAFPFPTKEEA